MIPGLPSGSPSDTMTSGMMQPTDPAVSPDRGSANANSPEARGQQAGVGIAIFGMQAPRVWSMLLSHFTERACANP